MAGRTKVIDLAKELGVTSKDLLVALEGMGLKGKRAMSPLDQATATQLRIQLGRGRELPTETKPKKTRAVSKVAAIEPAAARKLAPTPAPSEVEEAQTAVVAPVKPVAEPPAPPLEVAVPVLPRPSAPGTQPAAQAPKAEPKAVCETTTGRGPLTS